MILQDIASIIRQNGDVTKHLLGVTKVKELPVTEEAQEESLNLEVSNVCNQMTQYGTLIQTMNKPWSHRAGRRIHDKVRIKGSQSTWSKLILIHMGERYGHE